MGMCMGGFEDGAVVDGEVGVLKHDELAIIPANGSDGARRALHVVNCMSKAQASDERSEGKGYRGKSVDTLIKRHDELGCIPTIPFATGAP